MLKSLALMDPGFTFDFACDYDNNVTSIVQMTAYTRDNFKRFGYYLSIDIMHQFVMLKSFVIQPLLSKMKLKK